MCTVWYMWAQWQEVFIPSSVDETRKPPPALFYVLRKASTLEAQTGKHSKGREEINPHFQKIHLPIIIVCILSLIFHTNLAISLRNEIEMLGWLSGKTALTGQECITVWSEGCVDWWHIELFFTISLGQTDTQSTCPSTSWVIFHKGALSSLPLCLVLAPCSLYSDPVYAQLAKAVDWAVSQLGSRLSLRKLILRQSCLLIPPPFCSGSMMFKRQLKII